MAQGAYAAGQTGHHSQDHAGRTPAQLYCLLAGAALLLAGLFGFIADATFDAGDNLQGDSFLGFEVNGWHNLVHVASGAFLLAMMGKRSTAKTAALAFGLVYGLVTVIGMIDGNDVFGILPVNGADNVLHLALSATGIAAGLMSRGDRDPSDDRRRFETGTGDDRAGRTGEPVRGATRERL